VFILFKAVCNDGQIPIDYIFKRVLPIYIVERNYLAKPKYYSLVNGTDPGLLIKKIAYILVLIEVFMLNVEVPYFA
jgi:hypothetical protein